MPRGFCRSVVLVPLVLEDDVQGMNDSGNVSQLRRISSHLYHTGITAASTAGTTHNCQQDVDQEVGTTTSLKEDSKRRKHDGEDDLADVSRQEVSIQRKTLLGVVRIERCDCAVQAT